MSLFKRNSSSFCSFSRHHGFHFGNQKFRFQRRPFLRLLLQKYIFRENFVVSLKSSSVFFVFSLSIISKRPAVRRFGTKKEVYWLFWRILVLKEVQDVASRLRDYLSDNFRKFGSVPKIWKLLRLLKDESSLDQHLIYRKACI